MRRCIRNAVMRVEGGQDSSLASRGLGQVLGLLEQIEERALIAVHAGQRSVKSCSVSLSAKRSWSSAHKGITAPPQGSGSGSSRWGLLAASPPRSQKCSRIRSLIRRSKSSTARCCETIPVKVLALAFSGSKHARCPEQVEDQVLLQVFALSV